MLLLAGGLGAEVHQHRVVQVLLLNAPHLVQCLPTWAERGGRSLLGLGHTGGDGLLGQDVVPQHFQHPAADRLQWRGPMEAV